MIHRVTLEIPDDVFQTLQQQARSMGKSLEEVTMDRVARHAGVPAPGTTDALMPFFGAWQMEPEERTRVEQMIDEERVLEGKLA